MTGSRTKKAPYIFSLYTAFYLLLPRLIPRRLQGTIKKCSLFRIEVFYFAAAPSVKEGKTCNPSHGLSPVPVPWVVVAPAAAARVAEHDGGGGLSNVGGLSLDRRRIDAPRTPANVEVSKKRPRLIKRAQNGQIRNECDRGEAPRAGKIPLASPLYSFFLPFRTTTEAKLGNIYSKE